MFILLNLKAYDTDLSHVTEAVATVTAETDVRIGIAPQTAHIQSIASSELETWAQGVSGVDPGSHTGSTLATSVAEAGATGTMLNHSENRLTLAALEDAIIASRAAELETVVCANTPKQIAAVAALDPDAVAIEPPELIGTGTPVSQADPEIVRKAISAAESIDATIPVLCGAGISTGEDLAAARDLGAEGVLLASGVALADNPTEALRDLIEPLV